MRSNGHNRNKKSGTISFTISFRIIASAQKLTTIRVVTVCVVTTVSACSVPALIVMRIAGYIIIVVAKGCALTHNHVMATLPGIAIIAGW